MDKMEYFLVEVDGKDETTFNTYDKAVSYAIKFYKDKPYKIYIITKEVLVTHSIRSQNGNIT